MQAHRDFGGRVSRREQYQCAIDRDEDGRVQSITIAAIDLSDESRSVTLNSVRAGRVAAQVHSVMKAGGVQGRTWTQRRAFELDQVTGAHSELLLLAVKPLRRADRLEQVAEGIASMSREEASYWHAKARMPGGLRALRVLLTMGKMR